MPRLIIVPTGEAERHAADRILGALETSERLQRECLDGAGQAAQALAEDDLLLLVAGDDWPVRAASGPASTWLDSARDGHSEVRLVLLDDAPEPEAVELPETLASLGAVPWHPVRHANWAGDMANLIDELAEPLPVAAGPVRRSPARQMLIAAGLIGALALLGALLVVSRMWSETPDVVGRWVAEVDYGRSVVHQEQFEFRVAGGQIAGSATWLGSRRVIEAAVRDGERLSFHTRSHENRGSERRELRHDYVGIVSGDRIRFSLRTGGGFDERTPVEFEARRAQ